MCFGLFLFCGLFGFLLIDEFSVCLVFSFGWFYIGCFGVKLIFCGVCFVVIYVLVG